MKSKLDELRETLREDLRDTDRVNAKAKKPGMYLDLFHGRADPDQDMEDWGEQGPIIGPLEYGHTTYSSTLRIRFNDVNDHDLFFMREVTGYNVATGEVFFEDEAWLEIKGDMVFYEGMYYGDWSFFYYPGE